jgi:hypothetical protein
LGKAKENEIKQKKFCNAFTVTGKTIFATIEDTIPSVDVNIGGKTSKRILRVVTVAYITTLLREEYRLRVFENRVLRGIFGPKRDEVTGGWRKLHNEELHNLYGS